MRIYPANEQVWWRVARRATDATFFHTPLWHRLAESAIRGCRDQSVAVELDSGRTAVVPLLARRSPLLRRTTQVLSTFAGCYGGLISDAVLTEAQRAEIYDRVVPRLQGAILLAGNPFSGDGGGLVGIRAATAQFGGDRTQALRLEQPADAVISRFSRGHRSGISKARRLGVTTRVADTSADVEAYWRAYRASLRRWGRRATSRYPRRLFTNGLRLANEFPDALRLWLAELDGRVVAGAWVFYWNRVAIYWHGAALREGHRTAAVTTLFADVIADAVAQGCAWFDFQPSGGHAGVAEFKRRFGAEPLPFRRARLRGGSSGSAQGGSEITARARSMRPGGVS